MSSPLDMAQLQMPKCGYQASATEHLSRTPTSGACLEACVFAELPLHIEDLALIRLRSGFASFGCRSERLASFRWYEIPLSCMQSVSCSVVRFGQTNLELMPLSFFSASAWRVPQNVAVAEFTVDLGCSTDYLAGGHALRGVCRRWRMSLRPVAAVRVVLRDVRGTGRICRWRTHLHPTRAGVI